MILSSIRNLFSTKGRKEIEIIRLRHAIGETRRRDRRLPAFVKTSAYAKAMAGQDGKARD